MTILPWKQLAIDESIVRFEGKVLLKYLSSKPSNGDSKHICSVNLIQATVWNIRLPQKGSEGCKPNDLI